MRALGIDIGTTKTVVISLEVETGAVRVCEHVATPTLSPTFEGEHIQDAAAIIREVKRMVDAHLTDDVCTIGISGQMHGIVYLDDKGETVSPLYTWQDTRGAAHAEALGISVGYGHATHAYNAENGLVPLDAVGYATVADAVACALCGVSTPVLHASNAASLGCFDIDKNRFVAPLKERYPYEVESGYRLLGSYRGVPVAIGIGDNQASVLGSGCRVGDLLVNVGTGSQVSMLSNTPVSGNGIETRPAFDGQYLLVGAALCGGRAYAMLHGFFCDVVEMATGKRPESLYEAMGAYQKNAPDASLRFDNTFCGTRQNPSRRGSINGIGTDNFTPEQFCIGILEGIVGELAELYGTIGLPVQGLVGAGNALRKNPLLKRLCEKRFGLSLHLPAYGEEAAVGAALYALISAKQIPDARAAATLIRGER
ncbi:MAG: hypothetical protein J6R04_04565 [Clostridia bacterium]|nr:hypothetical protein [Clostridia bacterium]